MGYLGYKPADKPLTSADITDGIIVNADIANSTIDLTTKVTGTLPTSKGGTGLTTLGTANQVLAVNSGATALEFATPSGGVNTPAFFALRSGNQTILNQTNTVMQINNEIIDTAGCYDPTTNYRFTPTTSGKYFLFASTTLQNFTSNKMFIVSIQKNGTDISSVANSSGGVTDDMGAYIGVLVSANGTTDYFTANVYQSSSASQTMTTGAIFGGYKIIE
jgi:hypothetical protein